MLAMCASPDFCSDLLPREINTACYHLYRCDTFKVIDWFQNKGHFIWFYSGAYPGRFLLDVQKELVVLQKNRFKPSANQSSAAAGGVWGRLSAISTPFSVMQIQNYGDACAWIKGEEEEYCLAQIWQMLPSGDSAWAFSHRRINFSPSLLVNDWAFEGGLFLIVMIVRSDSSCVVYLGKVANRCILKAFVLLRVTHFVAVSSQITACRLRGIKRLRNEEQKY